MVATPAPVPKSAPVNMPFWKDMDEDDPAYKKLGLGSNAWFDRIFRHQHLGSLQINRLRKALAYFATLNRGGAANLTEAQWRWRVRAQRAVRAFDADVKRKVRLANLAKKHKEERASLESSLRGVKVASKSKKGGDQRSLAALKKKARKIENHRKKVAVASCSQ